MSELEFKLAGLIYGDGFISKSGNIRFHHSLKQQLYVEYKLSILKEMGFKVKSYISNSISGFSKVPGYVGYTTSTTIGKNLRNKFYPNNKKNIPIEILENFGWDQWAIIYQDDGRVNKISHINQLIDGKRTRKNTATFVNRYEISLGYPSDDEIDALLRSLGKLGVEASILLRKDGQRNISISKKESKIVFYRNIKPLVHLSMSYKIDIIPTLSLLQ